jgi:Protein of unknown function (DUF3017)
VKHSAKALARAARTQRASADSTAGTGRRIAAQAPYWIVLAGVIAGLATVGSGGQAVRGGTLVIAGALLAGSVARLVLPAGKAGMLGSRRRLVDVAVLGALGVGLLVAGLIVVIPSS